MLVCILMQLGDEGLLWDASSDRVPLWKGLAQLMWKRSVEGGE